MLIHEVPQPDAPMYPGDRGAVNNDMAKAAIWSFFASNPDRVILKVSFIKVRVRDLRVLFELIAGPEPR